MNYEWKSWKDVSKITQLSKRFPVKLANGSRKKRKAAVGCKLSRNDVFVSEHLKLSDCARSKIRNRFANADGNSNGGDCKLVNSYSNEEEGGLPVLTAEKKHTSIEIDPVTGFPRKRITVFLVTKENRGMYMLLLFVYLLICSCSVYL